MRTLKWNIIIGGLILLIPVFASAQFTDTKEIRKTFPVTPETQIEITNKYGKIDIKNWEKDSVKFVINIRVEEKKLSKLEESIDDIDFDITNNEHYLIVRTAVEKNKSTLAREIKKFKETLLSSDGNIQVDYTVWMPNLNRIKIDNKFGDIYIGDHKGDADITLSNGNLKAHDFVNRLNLTLNFADVSINSIKEARLDCNFSELYVKDMGEVYIQSRSTEFDLQRVENLSVDSRRDQYKIRQVELLDGQSSFTTFRINELTYRAKIQAEYGDVEIEQITIDFSNINIESKSTDINLYFNAESQFNFELKQAKAEVNFSKDFTVEKEETIDDKENEFKINGHFRSPSDDDIKLNINANSGNINILTSY
ncbi:MAG TPA: hypothetical protein VEP89_13270 [Draconibacterium sp.]|nr:hypothetical protein [Draconibacterium sp.]